MDDLLTEFLTETAESLDVIDLELVTLESDPNNRALIDKIFRLVHTIKGTCGFLGLPRLETVAHASETVLGKVRDGELAVTSEGVTLILASLDRIKEILAHLGQTQTEPEGDDAQLLDALARAAEGDMSAGPGAKSTQPAIEAAPEPEPDQEPEPEAAPVAAQSQPPARGPSREESAPPAAKGGEAIGAQSIRVNVDVIENLMTMVSELVLTRNQLLEMVRHLDDSEFKVPLQRLSAVTGELQDAVMKTRMQPIGNAWSKLPRIVRDLAHELGKKIDLQMIGAETELDRQVLEMIKDPLTHMVRNSADHGLELPEERRAAGKAETGRITLRAYHEGGHILIEVRDDGRGLDCEKIRQKALARGLATEGVIESMSEAQLQKFIFHPGFSTAAKVTNVSGRGVGMDVVRTNIEQIGGTIELRSQAGKGTTFLIKIPLTLAIVSALIVSAGEARFAVPQLAVRELVRVAPGSEYQIERIQNAAVLRLRNKLLPLVSLSECLGMAAGASAQRDAFIIVTQVGRRQFGIIVDAVFDTEEIVVKPVASILRDIPLFSGNTIMGDGSVIMIVDPNGLADAIAPEQGEEDAGEGETVVRLADRQDKTAFLIVKAGNDEPLAVPLALVTRLEEIECEKLETAGGRTVVQYRGRLMPVIHPSGYIAPERGKRQPLLVFAEGDRVAGIAVDEIVDIVEERLSIELEPDSSGTLGTAVLRGRATRIFDVAHYLTSIHADWFSARLKATGQGRRVLLVDDSAFFRSILEPLLRAAGYLVTSVGDAAEALRLREQGESFDAILSDIEMPDTDGFGFAAAVKAGPGWETVPLIAVSAHGEPDDIARGLAAGFDAYVSKSDRDQILGAIADLLTGQRAAA
ncbi:MAG: chemotaxis protein CheW [Alphaproteobacteria bacterium]|nr:chemotaxis protein CheW [Alphaproteobacteria bacterium]